MIGRRSKPIARGGSARRIPLILVEERKEYLCSLLSCVAPCVGGEVRLTVGGFLNNCILRHRPLLGDPPPLGRIVSCSPCFFLLPRLSNFVFGILSWPLLGVCTVVLYGRHSTRQPAGDEEGGKPPLRLRQDLRGGRGDLRRRLLPQVSRATLPCMHVCLKKYNGGAPAAPLRLPFFFALDCSARTRASLPNAA